MSRAISTAEVIDLVASVFGQSAGRLLDDGATDYVENAERNEEVARLVVAAKAVIQARKTHKSGYVSADLFAELEIASDEWSV